MSIKTTTRGTSSPAAASPSAPVDAARASVPAANQIESHTLVKTDFADARHTQIAEAAYRRAQARGFAAGEEWQDWFEAERAVDALLDREL